MKMRDFKIVDFPYRWTFRTFVKNIKGAFWDIRNGCSNLIRFFPAVWWYRSWDWTGLAHLMETAMQDMEYTQEHHSYHIGRERYARQLRVAAALCRRLQEDEYFSKAGYGNGENWDSVPDHQRIRIFKHAEYMAKQDAEYLGKIIKYIRYWWS